MVQRSSLAIIALRERPGNEATCNPHMHDCGILTGRGYVSEPHNAQHSSSYNYIALFRGDGDRCVLCRWRGECGVGGGGYRDTRTLRAPRH